MIKFIKPDFSRRDLEVRIKNDECYIYGTKKGLTKLLEICQSLISKPGQDHIHLDDMLILTDKSKICDIAIFSKE